MSQNVEGCAYGEILLAAGYKIILLQTWNFFSTSLLPCSTNGWSSSPCCHQVPGSFRSFGKMIYVMLSFGYGNLLDQFSSPWALSEVSRSGDALP